MIARSLRKERERERGLERASERREGERVREIRRQTNLWPPAIKVWSSLWPRASCPWPYHALGT